MKTSKRIILYEWIGFGILTTLLWMDEILDIPHFVFGSPATPVNWEECAIETVLVFLLGVIESSFTMQLLNRVKHLEGLVPICGFCQRVRNGKDWVPLEVFIKNHSDAKLAHGLNVCNYCQGRHSSEELHMGTKGSAVPGKHRTMMKSKQIARILYTENIGFAVLVFVLWMDEILDLPHCILNAAPTPINWGESTIETLLVVILGYFITGLTRRLLTRVKHLQGQLITCSSCNKIYDGNDWVPAKTFIQEHSQAEFCAAICFDCLAEKFCNISSKKKPDL